MSIIKLLLLMAACLFLIMLLVKGIERSAYKERLIQDQAEGPTVWSTEYRLRHELGSVVLQRGYYIRGQSGLRWADVPTEDSGDQ